MSTSSRKILVSKLHSLLKELNFLGKWLILGLGKGKYKMSLAHLVQKISKEGFKEWWDISMGHRRQLKGLPMDKSVTI